MELRSREGLGTYVHGPGFQWNTKAAKAPKLSAARGTAGAWPQVEFHAALLMGFDVSVTGVAHFVPERDQDMLQALAIVVNDNMAGMVSKLLFSYLPTVFRTKVFDDETAARDWLRAQLVAIAQKERCPPHAGARIRRTTKNGRMVAARQPIRSASY